MQNRPSKKELLQGVIRFLWEEAVEQLDGRAKFHARVAARAADIVLRELEGERKAHQKEQASLLALLGELENEAPETADESDLVERHNRELVRRIQAGELDQGPEREEVIRHLKEITVNRLEVNNPKMAEVVRRDFGL